MKNFLKATSARSFPCPQLCWLLWASTPHTSLGCSENEPPLTMDWQLALRGNTAADSRPSMGWAQSAE